MGDGVAFSIDPPDAPEVERDAGGYFDDATRRADPPPTGHELAVPPPGVEQVRDMLDGAGRVLETLTRRTPLAAPWRLTDDELDGLAPPLARIAARRPALARAIENADELTVALMLASYLGERVDVIAQRREQEGDDDGDGERQAPRPGQPPLAGVVGFDRAPVAQYPGGGGGAAPGR